MENNIKLANYPYSLVSSDMFGRHLANLFNGEVINGLDVIAGSGMSVLVQPGNVMIPYMSGGILNARMVTLVSEYPLTSDAADPSNPRIDLIVLYVDNSVSLPVVDANNPPSSANTDGPAVAKLKVIKGAPNANPQAPNDAAIQAAIGGGNPYAILYRRLVPAGATVTSQSDLTDVRKWAKVKPHNINGIWWEEVGRATLSGNTATVQVPLKKYLQIVVSSVTDNQSSSLALRVNGATSGYAYRAFTNFTAAGVATSAGSIQLSGSSGNSNPGRAIVNINNTGLEKVISAEYSDRGGPGAATAPGARFLYAKWAGSAPIESITFLNTGAGSLAGTEFVVLGHD